MGVLAAAAIGAYIKALRAFFQVSELGLDPDTVFPGIVTQIAVVFPKPVDPGSLVLDMSANGQILNVTQISETVYLVEILAEQVDQQAAKVLPLFENGDYASALSSLASLRAPVDNFFDEVMVMADDEAVRNNRLALLNRLRNLFLRVADISLLPTAG